MELFVFLDLDDTLFQTQRKCPSESTLIPAAWLKNGEANSFFTEKQHHLFKLLQANTHLIPTTARNQNTFFRTCVKPFKYAIINHGGLLLTSNGTVDSEWLTLITAQITPFHAILKTLKKQCEHFAKTQNILLTIRLIEERGLTFYLSIKHPHQDHHVLKLLHDQLINPYLNQHQLAFYCHLNDNNLAILPNCLSKTQAVAYLLKRLNKQYTDDMLSFGIGDSVTDIPYMKRCDYFITPTHSQIMQQGFFTHDSP